jgi:hypothetical protein
MLVDTCLHWRTACAARQHCINGIQFAHNCLGTLGPLLLIHSKLVASNCWCRGQCCCTELSSPGSYCDGLVVQLPPSEVGNCHAAWVSSPLQELMQGQTQIQWGQRLGPEYCSAYPS